MPRRAAPAAAAAAVVMAAVAGAPAAAALRFERPVLVGKGDPGSEEHYWFPEDGAAFGGAGGEAVVANVRFTNDGGASPALPHHTETRVSWDRGASYEHLWYERTIPGTPTQVVGGALVGAGGFARGADNRSFAAERFRFAVCPGRTICANGSAGRLSFAGFPFDVARFTYASKVVPLSGGQELAQLRAYSHKMNEAGGADENLAAFGSIDGGYTWAFRGVVATRNATLAAEHWEGPGENDLVQLRDGRLLAVFRVESCKPYWKSYSADGGRSWTPPEALPFGSARPKLRVLPAGGVLLSGGRPGLFVWVGDAAAESWAPVNVAAAHNELLPDAPDWRFPPEFVNSSDTGAWVRGSTSYTSLLDVGNGTYVLQYDRLANGWHMPPGPWGDCDRTFSMRFTL